MSRRVYEFVELGILIILAAIVLSFLPACASEAPAPIQAYRVAYGFDPPPSAAR